MADQKVSSKQSLDSLHKQVRSGLALSEATRVSPVSVTETLQHVVVDPRQARPAQILALQRAAGNQAVSGLIQAKLVVGAAGDQYEQEADQVAERVLSMPTPVSQPSTGSVQRQEDEEELQMSTLQRQEEEEEIQTKPLAASITPLIQRQEDEEELQMSTLQRQEEEEEIQTKPLAASITPLIQRQEDEEEIQMAPLQRQDDEEEPLQMAPLVQLQRADGSFDPGSEFEQRLSSTHGDGRSLPSALRAEFEPRFGADFSGVRVHTDNTSAILNRQLSAQAFTHGLDIYMGAGRYVPGTTAGKRLLAHELTHVVQQTGPQRLSRQAAQVQVRLRQQDGGATIARAPKVVWQNNPLYEPKQESKWHENPLYEPKQPAPVQGKLGAVRDKTHTRLVAGALTGSADAQASQIGKSPMHTQYNKGQIIRVSTVETEHIKDKDNKTVVWYRVAGTTNEYIRAEKVLLGIGPGSGEMKEDQDSKVEQGFAVTKWAGEAMTSADDRLLDHLRGLTAEKEKAGDAGFSKTKELSNITYGEGAAWTGSGLLGMAVALKDLCSDDKSAAERVEAAFNYLASGMGVTGGVAQIIGEAKSSDLAVGVSGFAMGFQEFFAGIANLVKTAKSGVDMIKMVAEQVKGEKSHSRDEWVHAGAELLQGALETLKSAARTARAINEAILGVQGASQAVTSTVSQFTSSFALGLDIAIAAVKSVFQGYYLAVSARQWWLMNQRKKELEGDLTQKYSKEQVKEARSEFGHGEAMKATLDQLIAKNQKAIAAKQDTILKMSLKGPQWLLKRRVNKAQTLQDEISALEEQNKKYKTQKAQVESDLKVRETARKEISEADIADLPEADASAPGLPTRTDLAEVELVSELGAANQKRVIRQSIHIGANLVQIAGSIAAFVSGPGAPAAIGLKAAAAGVETSLPFFRALKQFGRNIAAKNMATAGKKGIAGHIFNADKSTAAKLQARKRHAVLILTMVAGLNNLIPKETKPEKAQLDALRAQMKRVEGYIEATGCDPAKLYRANGNPQQQIKILVEEISKREF